MRIHRDRSAAPVVPATALAVTALAALAAACDPPTDPALTGITAASARIEAAQLGGFVVVGGKVSGLGTLLIVDDQGDEHELPIVLDGALAGAAFDVHGGFAGDMTLALPEAAVPANDLLGIYQGPAFLGHLIVGVQTHDLTNPAGVTIDATAFGLGIGIGLMMEWLSFGVDDGGDDADGGDGGGDAGPAADGGALDG